jgi:hypothetical protein
MCPVVFFRIPRQVARASRRPSEGFHLRNDTVSKKIFENGKGWQQICTVVKGNQFINPIPCLGQVVFNTSKTLSQPF